MKPLNLEQLLEALKIEDVEIHPDGSFATAIEGGICLHGPIVEELERVATENGMTSDELFHDLLRRMLAEYRQNPAAFLRRFSRDAREGGNAGEEVISPQ